MTTTNNAARRRDPRAARYTTLCLLALAAFLCRAHEARAQWTPNDAAGSTATTGTGRVGIGTAPSKGKLHVALDEGVTAGEHGIIYASKPNATGGVYMGYRANGTAVTGGYFRSTAFLPLFVGTNSTPEAMTISDNGQVGIGTPNPLSLFHLHGSSPVLRVSGTATDQHLLMTFNDNNNATKGFVGYLGANGTGSRYTGIINTDGDYLGLGTTNPTPVYFFLGGAATHVMAANGNVGIGTTAPASRLHVVGDVTVTGNINAKWQDVAEWVPSTQKLSAGTVVILDPQLSNHVLASTASYDTRVAGVVSAQPGLSLGEAGEGKALVATTGRVKVRVDASRAPIHIGDLLVTSDVAGVAMKSEPIRIGGRQIHAPGTLIGKALEPLEKGTGEILVLLSLQ